MVTLMVMVVAGVIHIRTAITTIRMRMATDTGVMARSADTAAVYIAYADEAERPYCWQLRLTRAEALAALGRHVDAQRACDWDRVPVR